MRVFLCNLIELSGCRVRIASLAVSQDWAVVAGSIFPSWAILRTICWIGMKSRMYLERCQSEYIETPVDFLDSFLSMVGVDAGITDKTPGGGLHGLGHEVIAHVVVAADTCLAADA
jgi:hypothetical protein